MTLLNPREGKRTIQGAEVGVVGAPLGEIVVGQEEGAEVGDEDSR